MAELPPSDDRSPAGESVPGSGPPPRPWGTGRPPSPPGPPGPFGAPGGTPPPGAPGWAGQPPGYVGQGGYGGPGFPQQPGTMPGPGGMPPQPPPRRIGMRVLGAVVALVVVIGGLLVFGLIRWAGHEVAGSPAAEPAAFAVGGCVRVSVQPSVIRSVPNGPVLKSRAEYAAAGCSDKSAYAKITMLKAATAGDLGVSPNGGRSADDVGCPPDTDEIAVVKSNLDVLGRNACMRNLAAPHPGDPGQGGGLVRQGDCLQVLNTYSANIQEVACTNTEWKARGATFGKEWFGQIVSRTDTVAGCPASATYTVTVRSGPGKVLCLAKNGGWMPVAGDCVDSNLFNRTPARRPCTDKYLAARITALVPAGRACPGGARAAIVPGYIKRVCLRSVT